jgi:signal transduction histidine kinase
VVRDGSFGRLVAGVATPLALVLVELVANAAEHGLRDRGGNLAIVVRREGAGPRESLVVTVSDDGPGPPPGFDIARDTGGLGLQIVRTLVEGELGGELTLLPRDDSPVPGDDSPLLPHGGGARIQLRVPLPEQFHDHEGSAGSLNTDT